jgi:DNA-directed RNA polymerase sigma subunit (sigma70/sigma32)
LPNLIFGTDRRIFEARQLADEPITLQDLAAEFGVSRERGKRDLHSPLHLLEGARFDLPVG